MRSFRFRSVASLFLASLAMASQAAPATPPRYAVSGLEKPVKILIDRWGVPHIYANALYDAFYAQGFMAARDRLWQIDLWRKRGLGQMAQDFGPGYVDGDRMARAVLFRGEMSREWLTYGSDAKRVAEAFVAGVNAYVAQTEADPTLLPPEFALLHYRPARWQAEDIVRIRHHGLTLNFMSEVTRAQMYCKDPANAPRADWLRYELAQDVTPALQAGLDPCTIPAKELELAYGLATASARFPKQLWTTPLADTAAPGSLYVLERPDSDTARAMGSNNWVIAPSRTSTGRPILANDPHRAHGAPSLRYIAHLEAPGLSVIGAGEPFLPGISIGHNANVGFGLTRFYMDQEDLYVYQTNPANPRQYLYKGRWQDLDTVTESIIVKGEAVPRQVTLDFTRHGPVLVAANGHAYALRAAWLEPGMAPYFGSIEYMRAQSWNQFRAAMNRWGAPGENQVYADRAGNIGWQPGGLTVIRPNWDGLTPVPGDGSYEWAGFRSLDELPWAFNPPGGFLVTANENNIPASHPAAKLGVGYEWANDFRARRLRASLGANARSSLADSMAWQSDTVSLPAQAVVAMLRTMPDGPPALTPALTLLREWDGNVKADSAAAALFEVWFSKHLRPALVKAVVTPALVEQVKAGDVAHILALLTKPADGLSEAARNEVVFSSLASALTELHTLLGTDMQRWQWGTLHRAVFNHPLGELLTEAQARRFAVDAGPIGGTALSPQANAYRTSDFQLTGGPSFRMVLDVGNWDASQVINTPGQSGNPDSPHYRDLAPLWAKNAYFPLVYSAAAVRKASRETVLLVPAPAKPATDSH